MATTTSWTTFTLSAHLEVLRRAEQSLEGVAEDVVLVQLVTAHLVLGRAVLEVGADDHHPVVLVHELC